MKRHFLMLLLIITAAQVATAQITTITGSVQDDKGNPLHFVFVGDGQYKEGAYTDSTGNFAIRVHPDSKLKFELPGYSGALVSVDKNTNLQVVLKAGDASASNSSDAQNTISAKIVEEKSSNDVQASVGYGGEISPSHQKGNLRGNRYLLDKFAHGFLVNSDGMLVHNANYLFDYDKMDGSILLTRDKKTIVDVGWDLTKSFTLYSNKDERFEFEKVPSLDKTHFVQVLASGSKYKIYKVIKTRFVKSDYVNNGVTSHGNDYDEYVDDADYYVLDVQGSLQKKLSLKKKSIKEDFAKDADKVNKYLSDNSGDIDDAYLSKLGTFMNQ
ncbi:MAG: carboxypeptidase-like regulatory domain-containing protein [Mucilaginibacter sp.]